MAYFFGASAVTDVFVAAFRIPNLLRDLFAEGALSSAFVPVFKEKLVKEGNSEAFNLARIVATAILLFVGAIVLLGILATPLIIYISANGFTEIPEKFDLTISLTRIMFVYLLLVSLSALVMGMLNSFGRFGIPAFSPVIFNLGVILTVVLLYSSLNVPIYAMAIGVLVGGVGQLAIQLPSLYRLGFRFKPVFDLLNEAMKKVIRLFTPMVLGLSASRINILVSTLLASFLMEGSLSFLNYSYRLMHFPLGVFAVALGTVALPNASEQAARGDLEGLNQTLNRTLGLNFFVILPSTFFLALFGPDLVSLIFEWGAFSAADTQSTALALLHYSYGLIGFAAVRLIVPIYYALQDSKLPMKVSIVTVAFNIALYFPLIEVLEVAGLAAATSLAGLLNATLLLVFLPSRGLRPMFGRLFLNITRLGVAAFLAVFVAMMVVPDFRTIVESSVLARGLGVLASLVLSGLLYVALCAALRVPEVGEFWRWVKGRLSRG